MITNMLSAIPWIGKDLVEFIWGGFSVGECSSSIFATIVTLAVPKVPGFWRFKNRVTTSVTPAHKRLSINELAWIVGIACKVGAFIIVPNRAYISQRFEIKVLVKHLPQLLEGSYIVFRNY